MIGRSYLSSAIGRAFFKALLFSHKNIFVGGNGEKEGKNMENVKEHGLWAWYRKPVIERLGIALASEYKELGKHHHNLKGSA